MPYLQTPQVFVCPAGNNDIPAAVRAGKPEDAAKWVNEHSDYVYLGGKMKAGAAGAENMILVHERLENHEGQGINIAFGDGHVEWVTMPRAKELIEAQKLK